MTELQDQVASPDDCRQALRNLSDEEVRTLHAYASFKMSRIRGRVSYADGIDLLQEAISRTLDGLRRWKPAKIDFPTHLKGTVRSIANAAVVDAIREGKAITEIERSRREKDESADYEVRQMFDRTRAHFKNDEIVLKVFELLLLGHSRAEICGKLRLRADAYDAARKRISRFLYGLGQ